jgi:hypothetical protein
MTQTTAVASKTASNGTTQPTSTPPRFTTTQPRVKKPEKKDRKKLIEDWTIKTDIVNRIKKIPVDKVHAFVIDLSPDMCMDVLKLNDTSRNRYLDEGRIVEYTSDMKTDNFPVNGDTICVDWNFNLVDGQHRLWAGWESGKTLPAIIVTGLDPKVIAYKDIGKNRSAHDIVVINQFGNNSTAMAAAIKNIIYYKETGKVSSSLGNRKVPNRLVQNFMKKKSKAADLNEFIEFGKVANEKVKNWLSPSQWGFVYYTLYNLPFNDPDKSQKRVTKFLELFYEGTNMAKTDPIMKLRDAFMGELKSVIKSGKKNKVAGGIATAKIKLIFQAWNHWFKGEKVQELEVDLKDPIIPAPIFR